MTRSCCSPRTRTSVSSPASASPSPTSTSPAPGSEPSPLRGARSSSPARRSTPSLDHGYALTIHRPQGATYDRAHVLANGGGRELAYVALSRARNRTTLHAIADNLPQLRHDLALDWQADRGQRWITDEAGPEIPSPENPPVIGDAWARKQRIRERLDALQHRPARRLDDDIGLGL